MVIRQEHKNDSLRYGLCLAKTTTANLNSETLVNDNTYSSTSILPCPSAQLLESSESVSGSTLAAP